MVFKVFFVRRAYTQVLAHELKRIVRMLRAFPADRFDARESGCGESARELAMGVVRHVRRIDEIAYGFATHPMRTAVPSRGEILLALESAFLGAHSALATLPASRWEDVVQAPIGFSTLRQARRGELLWLALRELIRHNHHFALHVRGAVHGDGGPSAAAPAADPAVREMAFGA
jgi:hypothetical protein